MTKARDLASSGVTLTSTTTTADAALARAGGTMTGNLAMGTNLVDGVDVSARDAVLTDTTTKATAALPKAGGAMTGAITTNSTFDGVDIATRDGILSSTTTTATAALNNANSALSREGGAMTGAITTNSTFDGVDVGARNSVLTSTTTTANAALPKSGGAMTGAITTNSTFDGRDVAADGVLATNALPKSGGDVTGLLKLSSIDPILRFNDTNGGTDTKNFEMRYVGTSSPDIDGLYFRTANDALNSYSDKMVILGSGNVGIGIAAPAQNLAVKVGSDIIVGVWGDNSAGYGAIQSANVANNVYKQLRFDASSYHFAQGNVGIGTAAPDVPFVVSANPGAAAKPVAWLHNSGNVSGYDGVVISSVNDGSDAEVLHVRVNNSTYANGTSLMLVRGDGEVLIGKTVTALGTAGVRLNSSGISMTRANGSCLTLNLTGNDAEVIGFYKDTGYIANIGVSGSNNLYISGTVANHCGITLGTNQLLPTVVSSIVNGTVDLGGSGGRWKQLFATNSTISTSDRNEKQDIAALTSTEMLVAKRISALFKTFRWKDKVATEGDDARTHTGTIAQDVQSAFSAEGLDAGDYSLFTSGSWWEHDVEVAAVEADDTAEPAIEAADAYTRTDIHNIESEAPEGSTRQTRLGIRYSELLSFLAAYNEQRFAAIETRLTELEA